MWYDFMEENLMTERLKNKEIVNQFYIKDCATSGTVFSPLRGETSIATRGSLVMSPGDTPAMPSPKHHLQQNPCRSFYFRLQSLRFLPAAVQIKTSQQPKKTTNHLWSDVFYSASFLTRNSKKLIRFVLFTENSNKNYSKTSFATEHRSFLSPGASPRRRRPHE